MITRLLIPVLTLLSCSPFITAQTRTNEFKTAKVEEYIDWSADRKLKWTDYLALPDENSDAAATTSTALGIEYKLTNGSVLHRIICRFSTTKSWGRNKTEYILAHEQCHFDITEIYARKLNQAMLEYKFDSKNYKGDLDKIYQKIVKEKQDFQKLYDLETDHSRNKEKQKEWLKKIEDLLKLTEDFAKYN